MDKTEVTYAHWKRVYKWAVAHGYSFDNAGSGKGANHPVSWVNWFDCVKWCNARSEMEGRRPAYTVDGAVYRTGRSSPNMNLDGEGYRLPMNEEWEYAARGGLKGRRFPWGNKISHRRANYWGYSSTNIYDSSSGAHPRFDDGKIPFTAPVASFSANGYGLYDMAGNIREWTATASGAERNIRGGDCGDAGSSICRCGFNYGYSPSFVHDCFGFRSVRRR